MPGFNINGEGDKGAPSGVEVARAHRWRFEFLRVHNLTNVQLYALSCARPSFEVDTKQLHYKQTQINVPGKYKWNPIDVTFYETAGRLFSDMTARQLFLYWSGSGNSLLNLNKNTLNREFRSDAKIYQELGDGQSFYVYTLKNSWPSKIEPSELNYSSSDIATIKVTLTYDAAAEEPASLYQD